MHIYIYDSYVNQKKFENVMARIETRITDLGLNGKIVRLGLMNSIYDIVSNEIQKGAKTIVAVGDNSTFNQTINAMASLAARNRLIKDVPLGFIPIGKENNNVAFYLGIDPEEPSCDILAARRIQKLDLGQANNQYFISSAKITGQGTTVEIDEDYSIETPGAGEITVINLSAEKNASDLRISNAKDGILELFIKTGAGKKFLPLSSKPADYSIFPFKNLKILNSQEPVTIDETVKIKTPVQITIAKEKIPLIVGKDRSF